MFSQLAWLAWITIIGLRVFLLHPVQEDVQVWVQISFAIILYFFTVITAWGIGKKLAVKLIETTILEQTLIALALGFGFIATGVLILGIIGQLTTVAVYLWLTVCGFASSFQWKDIFAAVAKMGQFRPKNLTTGRIDPERIFLPLLCLSLLALIPMALTPVRDYDALMYHLQIPRMVLENGRYYFDPAFYRLSYPALTELLFLIGIAFHVDIFSQWISLTYAILFFLSVYAYGRRFFNPSIAIMAVCILAGNPAFPTYATAPGNDFSWAYYDFWCVFALSVWASSVNREQRKIFLLLAGVMAGLAAGTKYLALPFIGIGGILVLGISREFKDDAKWSSLKNLAIFGLTTAVVASPWYVKNLAWTGNAFYPLIFGGPGWGALQRELLNDYMGSFGTGHGLLDLLLIPVNLYLAQPRFATMSLEIVHPLLWLGFAIFLFREWKDHKILVLYSITGFVVWCLSMDVIRFLLPLSGCLALLSARVIFAFPRSIKFAVSFLFIAGFMLITIGYESSEISSTGTLEYLSENMTTTKFLERNVYDYKMTEYILEHVDKTDRVLFLWSGQGYYCDSRCLPDDEQTIAILLSMDSPTPEALAHRLRSNGITHLLLGKPDAYWFISLHDPRNLHRDALEYFESTFLPTCGKSIFKDNLIELYQITCG